MQLLLAKRAALRPFAAAREQAARPSQHRIRHVTRAQGTAEVEDKKVSPLQKGGTLSGAQAFGKDASAAVKAAAAGVSGTFMQIEDGKFVDDRWKDGTWELSQFKGKDGETDWDLVIDAEIARRKLLEGTPIPSVNEDPVNFDTGMIPWWAWVRRFHLPVAEKANGRAAMIGYVLALFVDQLSGAGLLDQQNSFLGKVALHIVVFGVLFVQSSKDLQKYKDLLDEATNYDAQWNATWKGVDRPSETQQ